jgi:tripartite-type tricarboxylate transporter receptor subunit TctC
VAMPDVRKRFDDLGMAVIGNTPADFAAAIRSEIPHWTKVIKDAGVKITE